MNLMIPATIPNLWPSQVLHVIQHVSPQMPTLVSYSEKVFGCKASLPGVMWRKFIFLKEEVVSGSFNCCDVVLAYAIQLRYKQFKHSPMCAWNLQTWIWTSEEL